MPLAGKLYFGGIVAALVCVTVWHPPLLLAAMAVLGGLGAILQLASMAMALPSAMKQFRRDSRRVRQLSASRAGETICQLARSFDCRRTDTWVLRAVYEELQAHIDPYPFPIHADDALDELMIDREDLDMQIVWSIAGRARRSMENAERNPFYRKVVTVRDLVGFFVHQPPLPRGLKS